KNPPPSTTVTVQGFTPEPEKPRVLAVEMVPEPPAVVKDEVLPGRQKTTEGLETSVAGPVKVRKNAEIPHRIESASGEPCYAIVSKSAFQKLQYWHWVGIKSGHMYRRVKQGNGKPDIIRWLHRDAHNCNRDDKYIGFLDGDERNLLRSNIRIVNSKEEAKEIRRQALQRSANG
ncbi:MAG: hypothetical protein V4563_14475, partial [Pseudomonadota bacterium]